MDRPAPSPATVDPGKSDPVPCPDPATATPQPVGAGRYTDMIVIPWHEHAGGPVNFAHLQICLTCGAMIPELATDSHTNWHTRITRA